MIWKEIPLLNSAPLVLAGKKIGTMECVRLGSTNAVRLSLHNANLELPDSIDIGEQSSHRRVFLIENSSGDEFLIFGGITAYRLAADGSPRGGIDLFRSNADQEYWQTQILERQNNFVIIYEAGVLVIDETLEVRFHQPKLYNDVFRNIEPNGIRFVRDHDREWVMSLCESSTWKRNHGVTSAICAI